ncbi:MAG: iron-sulfur cluster-binding domain-containing protein, partial [Rhizobacter sp.]|nr:iron-sulfur cluster-binding domain-containing protein [Rhizobacter sp.]
FLGDLDAAPWRERAHTHFKDEGRRADLETLMPPYRPGLQLYTCGAPRYMDSVFQAAAARGWPEAALHREYFHVPEAPEGVNRRFVLRLSRSGRTLEVPAERSATDVLNEAGIRIDTKCSDGLCGVCATPYDAAASGAIEHRDFVLGAKERERRLILCCSRAAEEGGEIVVDL